MLLLVIILLPISTFATPVGDTLRNAVSQMGSEQTVGIRGQLMCGNSYLTNTKVKLWDEDSGPDPDDLLGEAVTNGTGYFEVFGTQKEMTNIDPRFNIYHSCGKKGGLCKRKVTFTIPDKYISNGNKVQKWMDFGRLNMEIITKGEQPYCI